jgi:hypothetical protein
MYDVFVACYGTMLPTSNLSALINLDSSLLFIYGSSSIELRWMDDRWMDDEKEHVMIIQYLVVDRSEEGWMDGPCVP